MNSNSTDTPTFFKPQMDSSIKLRFYPFKDGSSPFSRWHFNMGRSLAWKMFPCPRSWERECVICDTCEARWVKDRDWSENPENTLWKRLFARERVYTPALVGEEYDPVIFTTSAHLFRRAVGSLEHYDCLFRGYTFTYNLESADIHPRSSLSRVGDRTPVPMETNKLLSLIESAPTSKQLFLESLPDLAKQKELLASSIAEFWNRASKAHQKRNTLQE